MRITREALCFILGIASWEAGNYTGRSINEYRYKNNYKSVLDRMSQCEMSDEAKKFYKKYKVNITTGSSLSDKLEHNPKFLDDYVNATIDFGENLASIYNKYFKKD